MKTMGAQQALFFIILCFFALIKIQSETESKSKSNNFQKYIYYPYI